jgi:osmoprotectant transport system permease protein
MRRRSLAFPTPMNPSKWGKWVLLGLMLLAPTVSADENALRIGSKRFTESYILAQVLAQTAAPQLTGNPEIKQGLGNTAIVFEALRAGSIDVYPEYLGTISEEILRDPARSTLEAVQQALVPLGLGVAVPLGFSNGYALAMRQARAQQLGVAKLSELALQRGLRLGLSNEFLGRADGWRGLAQRYGLGQQPIALDHGLAYDALARGQVDVIDIYSTDAKIAQLGLQVLADDRQYFPRYDAMLLYRLDLPQRLPQVWAALQQLAGSISEAQMIAMNARAELHSVPFDQIARDHLAGRTVAAPPSSRGFWTKLFGPDLARLAAQHLALVGIAVAVAALLATPVGVLVFARPRLRAVVLGATGLLQTVPALALLAALISLLGAIGTLPALLALTLYALLPILRNTTTGLAGVAPGLRLAALALGMTPAQYMRAVGLPLALPTIVAGLRTATSIAIGTATIAAFIGAGGFGERIVTGLALNDGQLLLAGALPAAVLALLSEAAFETLDWRLRRRRV